MYFQGALSEPDPEALVQRGKDVTGAHIAAKGFVQ